MKSQKRHWHVLNKSHLLPLLRMLSFEHQRAWSNVILVQGNFESVMIHSKQAVLRQVGPRRSLADKETQCIKISKEFNYTHISTGELLRKEVSLGSDLGRQIDGYLSEGRMTPTVRVFDGLRWIAHHLAINPIRHGTFQTLHWIPY